MADAIDATKVVVTTEELLVRRRGFDLDTFEKVSLEGKVTFTPLGKDSYIQESLEAVGGDTEKHYALVNSAVRRAVKVEKRNELNPPDSMPNWIASPAVVMQFVNNFRNLPPYNAIKVRGDQTKAIKESIKAQPALVAALKTLALAAANAGVEDEDEDEE